jgi:DNA polymerase III subunit epsilon
MKPSETEIQTIKTTASEWAKDRLADVSTVIIDVESTGLLRQDPDTEIAQISVIDTQGRSLLSMLLKPNKPMNETVIDIHKITNEQVINQPTFFQVAKIISFVLNNKHVVSWNMDFDWKLIMHMYKKYEIEPPKIAGASCAMDRYSEWAGEWSEKRKGFKWQKLPNFTGKVSHDAFVDCENALKAIEKMTGSFDPSKVSAEEIDLDF